MLLEFEGGVTTTFRVSALYRSATHKVSGGELLCAYALQRGVYRTLLSADYNRVKISREKPKASSGTGFSRWRLRTLDVSDLARLSTTLSGKYDTLVYMDGRARVTFAWGGRFEFGELHFTPEAGGPAKRLTLDGRTRGTVTVPGNGFLAVRNTEAWTLERCGQGH